MAVLIAGYHSIIGSEGEDARPLLLRIRSDDAMILATVVPGSESD